MNFTQPHSFSSLLSLQLCIAAAYATTENSALNSRLGRVKPYSTLLPAFLTLRNIQVLCPSAQAPDTADRHFYCSSTCLSSCANSSRWRWRTCTARCQSGAMSWNAYQPEIESIGFCALECRSCWTWFHLHKLVLLSSSIQGGGHMMARKAEMLPPGGGVAPFTAPGAGAWAPAGPPGGGGLPPVTPGGGLPAPAASPGAGAAGVPGG